ncbi:hypothetical protein L6452_08160 [Arctium lappa]|uniref:Uncharacterized protein n=1 Tax=Arctium lappa TaxID=4217 RepID=A0ACB9DH01_ARCLA|nr:hypothetical protein L6452_08160 [Arctium lappa]
MRDMGTKMRELNATRLGVQDHMNRNKSNCLKVPMEVNGWLEEVGNIEAQVENIPSDIGRCFNLRVRHKLGRKAFKIIQDIDRLKEEKSRIDWTDHPIPLGKVDSIKCSKNLGALEIEFFGNKPLPKNMSFEKLETFKISLGCSLEDHYRQNMHSFENMLMLVTNKCELLDSKMNELFEKTKVLHLEVDGINDLGVGLVES